MSEETEIEKLAASGPFIRGTEKWVERELARKSLGHACVNIHPLPLGHAFGEKDANKQQVDTSKHREKVRQELRDRGVLC